MTYVSYDPYVLSFKDAFIYIPFRTVNKRPSEFFEPWNIRPMPSRQASHTKQQDIASIFEFLSKLRLGCVSTYTDRPFTRRLIPFGGGEFMPEMYVISKFVFVYKLFDVGLDLGAWSVESRPFLNGRISELTSRRPNSALGST